MFDHDMKTWSNMWNKFSVWLLKLMSKQESSFLFSIVGLIIQMVI